MIQFDLDKLRKIDFSPLIKTRIDKCGNKKKTLCPFHDETTPSFFIYPENSFYCFGCGEHGNAIDFVIKKFGYSFKETCLILEAL